MVAYEQQYDKKSHDQISTNLRLAEKRRASVCVSIKKKSNLSQLNKSIEEKFNNSSMNKTYAFPRKDDGQPCLANSVF